MLTGSCCSEGLNRYLCQIQGERKRGKGREIDGERWIERGIGRERERQRWRERDGWKQKCKERRKIDTAAVSVCRHL